MTDQPHSQQPHSQQPHPQQPQGPPPPRPSRATPAVIAIAALVAIAAVITTIVLVTPALDDREGTAGPSPTAPALPPDHAFAALRDQAVSAAAKSAVTLNTLDHRTFEAGYDAWLATATDQFRTYLETERDSTRTALLRAQARITAKATRSALEVLPPSGKWATALVVLEVTVIPEAGTPNTRTVNGFLQMENTPQGWLCSHFSTVGPDR